MAERNWYGKDGKKGKKGGGGESAPAAPEDIHTRHMRERGETHDRHAYRPCAAQGNQQQPRRYIEDQPHDLGDKARLMRRPRSNPLPIVRELRDVRLRLELPQRDVAARMGVQRQWVTDVECGRSTPRLDLFMAYANALGFKLVLFDPLARRFDLAPRISPHNDMRI